MEWISIKDHYPPKGEYVFVWGILENTDFHDVIKCRFFDVVYSGETKQEFWEAEWAYDITEVTHWMPLPSEPPKD